MRNARVSGWDSPVPIAWTSEKIKLLEIFIGNGRMDVVNWEPRISAVENCLSSWRSRSLSLQGKALVINALALSRIWYIASLVFMPSWVLSKLESIVFNFFWSGKHDLVARKVVVHPRHSGGLGVVCTKFKVYALLVQWIRRFLSSSGAWVSLLTFWFFDRFGVGPYDVLSDPVRFSPGVLSPFYCSLLQAWQALGGSRSQNA